MSKEIQQKSFWFKADDVQSNGIIRGYASTFGNVDYGMDVVDKGAFKKSIKESRGLWPILADHDPSKQIGFNLRAEETNDGLLVEGQLNLDLEVARDKYALAKQAMNTGARMGLSIGFSIIKAEPDRDKPMVRRLKELKMWEYSIVTFPMNPEATITNAKSLEEKAKFGLEYLSNEFGLTKQQLQNALFEKKDDAVIDEVGDIATLINQTNSLLTPRAAKENDPNQVIQSINEIIAELNKQKGE